MIGRVWGDALAFDDWALGLRPEGERPLGIWVALGKARAGARELLKTNVNRIRRRW